MATTEFQAERHPVGDFNDVSTFQMTQLGILGKSPSPDFIQDEESASICPLLTPSPPPNDFRHPLEPPLLNGKSPSPDFIPDEDAAFTCPLLSSPPLTTLRHPLEPLNGLPFERQTTPSSVSTSMTGTSQPMLESEVQYIKLDQTRENRSTSLEGGDAQQRNNSVPSELLESSSSSSSSALQENPSCAQLLSTHHYQHLNVDKNDVTSFITQETCVKPGLEKRPPDYCFLTWNWPLIRKLSLWTAISTVIACLCIVVAMVSTVPRRCYPSHHWYHGSVFYEVFPASYQDSNRDGMGDLRGLATRANYIQSLGVRAIRLNSIFPSPHYPEHFDQVTNLTAIEKSLGSIQDFKDLLQVFHNKSIHVVLDLPIYPYVKDISELKISINKKNEKKENVAEKITNVVHNHRSHRAVNNTAESVGEFTKTDEVSKKSFYIDGGIAGHMKYTSEHLNSISETLVEEALYFWFDLGVDGVYLKGLEHYVTKPKYLLELRKWKKIKASYSDDKLLMADYAVLEASKEDQHVSALLETVDLLDLYLDLSNGTERIVAEVDKVQERRMFGQNNDPWIHWNIGHVGTARLVTRVSNPLGAILFENLLPGTISIFYGDEIGLSEFPDKHNDRWDIQHLRQLAPMQWKGNGFMQSDGLPWLPYAKAKFITSTAQHVVHMMTLLRDDSPSIYMNSVRKENENLKTYSFRVQDEELAVLERSYPRRSSYLALYNTGVTNQRKDLSYVYYGGEVVVDSQGHHGDYIAFNNLVLHAGETMVVKLDK